MRLARFGIVLLPILGVGCVHEAVEGDDDSENLSSEAESGADEQPLSKSALPPAVQSAFAAAYPKAAILGVAREMKDGAEYYEIESREGDARRDLLYKPDGGVFEIEEALTPEQLPDLVTAAVKAQFPLARVDGAEKLTRGTMTRFEVSIIDQGVQKEVVVSSDGEIVEPTAVP